jgi:Iap family predicted aminopeptidase
MLLTLLLLACEEPTEPVDPLTATELEAATRALTDIGHRMVATDHEELARVAVTNLFVVAGLEDIASVPFVWDAWTGGEASITVGGESWSALPLSPSPVTHAELGALTTGEELEGAVYLASSADGSRAGQFADALLGGAEGLVRITEDTDPDGTRLIEVGHTLEGVSLPSLAVDNSVGDALWLLQGEQATVDIESVIHTDHTSYNVIGQISGPESGRVFVTAHYDSWEISECAFDNALGVGAMALLARKLRQEPPRKTVVFLATSGEEQGLRGSIAWVAEHETSDIEAVMNLDVLWSDEGSYYVGATDTWLREIALDHAFQLGLNAIDGGQPGLGSDHVAFVAQGVPATWSTRQLSSHYHTIRDTMEHLDFDEATVALEHHWRVLRELVY